MSRDGKIRLSRSKAIVIAARAPCPSRPPPRRRRQPPNPGHAAGLTGPREAPAGAPRLAVADQLARPVAGAGSQPGHAALAHHAFQLRLTQIRDAIAQRQAAGKRAAELATRKRAAELAASKAVLAASGSPRRIAQATLGSFGWSSSQFSCLDPLWEHESRWSVTAANPGSGAFGIPQALPGSRMAGAGPDWQTSAATQITWGMRYIRDTYGSPCAAWSHEQATGWY